MINVLFCGDQHAEDGVLITSLSLKKHVSEPLHLFILTMDKTVAGRHFAPFRRTTAALIRREMQAANPASEVDLIDGTPVFDATPPTANLTTRFTPLSMLRLYADQLDLPDRLLYLDNDVICRQDFSAFYHQDLEKTELVGVLDHYGKWFFHNQWQAMDYLNSGILLLNLAEIKRTGLFAACRDLLAKQQFFMPDQSALNQLAREKRLAPRRFNDQRRLHADTVFQHFTTSFRFFPWVHTLTVKPWQVDAVHAQLHLYEYDDVLAEYERLAPALRPASSPATISPALGVG